MVAFATGVVTYFGDEEVSSKILRTAEIAGHTVTWNGTKHYALANMALTDGPSAKKVEKSMGRCS